MLKFETNLFKQLISVGRELSQPWCKLKICHQLNNGNFHLVLEFSYNKSILPFLSEVDSNFFNWPKWTKPAEYIIFCCLVGYFSNVHNTPLFLQSYRTLKF